MCHVVGGILSGRCCHRRCLRHRAGLRGAERARPRLLGHRQVGRVLFRTRWVGRIHQRLHGFSSCDRRGSGRSPAYAPPFSARSRAMGSGRRAVDHLHVIGCHLHQSREQLLPHASARPAMEAVIDCRRRAVDRRTILPTAARFEHMNDAADHPAVIDATRARAVAGQKRINR